MAVFGFSACNGDYDDWAAPQSNAQEDAITIPGYTAAAAGAIDLNQAGESINMFTLSSAALPEGSTVENNRVKLTPTGEGVKDELSKTIELTADCKADCFAGISRECIRQAPGCTYIQGARIFKRELQR